MRSAFWLLGADPQRGSPRVWHRSVKNDLMPGSVAAFDVRASGPGESGPDPGPPRAMGRKPAFCVHAL